MNHIKSIIILFFLILFFPFVAQAAPAGKFTAVKGKVDITSPGQKAIPAKVGDEINVGDIIRTKSKSRAEITFLDDNSLRLAQSSRIEITEYIVGMKRISGIFKLFRGKIQNIIKAAVGKSFGLKKSNRYEVHTPTVVVGVRGTNFFTFHISGISGSTFKEGSGYGYSINRPDDVIIISAGQTMIATSPDILPVIRPATDLEMKNHEKETSPQGDEKETTGGGAGRGITNMLRQGAGEEKSTEERFIKEGIGQEMRGIERLDKGIDIPQQPPPPDHHSHY
ncbi:FecR domain-containing protein [Thermodesulfobacteriota bacterium]